MAQRSGDSDPDPDAEADVAEDLVRDQVFDTDGPVELDVHNGFGPNTVELTGDSEIRVRVSRASGAGEANWLSGLTGLLSWVGDQLGEGETSNATSEAVRQTQIELNGPRLAVRAPQTVPLRAVPLDIRVRIPEHSHLLIRGGAGDVTITGDAGRLQIHTGTGDVTAEQSEEASSVRTGSGRIHLGTVLGGVQARSGSGAVAVSSVEAASSIVTGSGDVHVGTVLDDLMARSGGGSLVIAEAASGQLELITGSGHLQVSIRPRVHAEVNLTSSTGRARSQLAISESPPTEAAVPLRLFGRTGSGEVVLASAGDSPDQPSDPGT